MNRSALLRCATILWAALFCTMCAHAERPRMGVFHRDLDGDGLAERQVIVNDARPDGSIVVYVRTYAHDGRLLSDERSVLPPNADLNADGMVDSKDLALLVGAWGQTAGQADINLDGVVDGDDLGILMGQFGVVATPRGDCHAMGCLEDQFGNCHCGGGGEPGPQPPDDDGSQDPAGLPTTTPPKDPGTDPGGTTNPNDDDEPECTAHINGPSFVGVGSGAVFSAGVPEPQFVQSVEWASPSPSNLVQVLSHEGGLSLRAIAPGTVTISATVTTTDGATCMADFEFDIIEIDLDIDSDNDGQIEADEDEIEATSGAKVIIVNRNDDDGDDIPDYADGFGAFGPDTIGGTPGDSFVPIELDIRGGGGFSDAVIRFSYDTEHPLLTFRTEVPVPGFDTSYFRYTRDTGLLRIWKEDADRSRTVLDYIHIDDELDAAVAAGGTRFYVEAVNGSPVPVFISVSLIVDEQVIATDAVRLLPFDSVTGLHKVHLEDAEPMEPEIAGFTIHRGMTPGTPGRDLILGTDAAELLWGGGGDDIIVAGDGDDVIDAGLGADVVFAWAGNNDITLEPSLIAIEGSGSDAQVGDALLTEEDSPFTTEQVLSVYKLLYGEDDPWLEIFLFEANGVVEAVEGDGVWFTKADWDRRWNSDQQDYEYAIQLEFDLGSPVAAATRMRQELLHLAAHWMGPTHIFQGEMIGLAFERAVAQEPFDEELSNYLTLRAQAFDNAAAAAAIIATAYGSGFAVASEGADFVLTVSEVTDGNVTAAIGFIPFVPATVTRAGRVIIKFEGNAAFEKITDITRRNHIAKGLDSGIGFILRRNMPWEEFRAVDGSVTIRLGTAQEVVDKYGSTTHAATVLRISEEMARTGEYEYITMNRAWKTAVADNPPLTGLTTRPDIIGVRRDGTVDAIEVISGGQTGPQLLGRLDQEMNSLPTHIQGDVFARPLDAP